MRKVEIQEDKLLDGVTAYHKGDTISVDESKAAVWISYGWAKDAETGEVGTRVPGAQPLKVADVKQASRS